MTNHLTVGPVDPVLLTGIDADIHHLLGHPLLHVTVVDHRVGEHHHLETIVQRNQSIAVNLTKGGSKSHHEVMILMHYCAIFSQRKHRTNFSCLTDLFRP